MTNVYPRAQAPITLNVYYELAQERDRWQERYRLACLERDELAQKLGDVQKQLSKS